LLEVNMRVDRLVVGPLQTNCYILSAANNDAIIIDPGFEPKEIINLIENKSFDAKYLLLTHAHYDHVGAAGSLQEEKGIPVFLHRADEKLLLTVSDAASYLGSGYIKIPSEYEFLKEGQTFKLGDEEIASIHVPGHTQGSVAFQIDDYLFVGDTLFYQGIGRTDLPGGSYEQLEESIRENLYTLDDDLTVYPGHGPKTTIGFEKANNPFVQSTEFI